jgi:hypothetical protein
LSYSTWYVDFDWSLLFQSSFEEDGIKWSCNEFDQCWSFDNSNSESCNYETRDCYSTADALEIYFEQYYQLIEYHEIWVSFNFENWRSNFDMSYTTWYTDVDWSNLFSHSFEEDGI